MKSAPSPLWQGSQPVLYVVALAFAVFANTLSCGFVWDDRAAILTNRDIRSDDTTTIADLFHHDFWGTPITSPSSHKSFRPITVLSFRLNHAIGAFDPWGYHFVNVLLHAVTSALVVVVGRRVTAYPRASQQVRAPVLAGLVFAVHPIHCDSVASVVGRADVLCTLVSLVAVLVYQNAMAGHTKANWMYFGTAISLIVLGAFFAVCLFSELVYLTPCAATMCKELGATTVAILVVLELLQLRQHPTIAYTPPFRLGLLVTFGVCAIAARVLLNGPTVLYKWTEMENDISLLPLGLPKALTIAHTHAWYLYKMAWPHYLSYDYGFKTIPIITSVADPRNLLTILAYGCVTALAVVALRQWRSCPSVLVMASFAIFPFVPAANVLFPVGTIVAERLLYFPSVGVSFLVGFTLDMAIQRASRVQHLALLGLVAALLVAAAARTISRNLDWADETALFEASVKVAPWSTKVLSNLSKVLLNSDAPRAAAYLERALYVLPQYPIGHLNLGLAYVNMGKLLHCMDSLLKASEIDHSLGAYSYLGKYMYEFHALHQRDKVTTEGPTHALVTSQKLLDLAISHNYNLPTVWFTRGLIAFYANDFTGATTYGCLWRVLYNNAGVWHKEHGHLDKAAELYATAIELFPGHGALFTNAGFLAESRGNRLDAINYYLHALELDPTNAQIQANFHNLQAKLAVPDVESELAPMPLEAW
ncbi:hypothetical protein DYB32_001462 [Aphanomyces invadans]|uniref:dolichyl-phosphate-mannose--protein mannosyltransferase n=1 Tax=Aphanomyces invadans TaxID=157072 RepID=A0A418B6D9_9STRA|nr:hypothetical protein DYB32_001462 [Aphanomyces invadans]